MAGAQLQGFFSGPGDALRKAWRRPCQTAPCWCTSTLWERTLAPLVGGKGSMALVATG